MPLPRTTNVGTIVSFLKKEHPEWSKAQVTAVALEQARKSGADIPKKEKK
jgi:hypothetical protein